MRLTYFYLLILLPLWASAQNNVAINNTGNAPDPSAMLDVQSTTKGMLVPRMDSTQRTMISNAAPGLLVYDTQSESFWFKDSQGWVELVSNARGLRDTDLDTRVEVEASPDDDMIRFVAGGYEHAKMDGKIFHLDAPGNSVFVGKNAGMNDNGTDNHNLYLGTRAGSVSVNGSQNIHLGYEAGMNNYGGSNTIIGYRAGRGVSPFQTVGNVLIGNQAGYNETGNGKLYIANSPTSAPLIYGEFSNQLLGINGKLGIGTQAPLQSLHVRNDGLADSSQTIVAVLQSDVSNRPILQFSEQTDTDLSSGMSIEYNGATGTGSANEMYINNIGGQPLVTFENSGDIGVGTTNPTVPLQVDGGSDASLTGGGYFMTNSELSTNIVIDNNEIMARDSGATATLYLQNDGGAIKVHGGLPEINEFTITHDGRVGIGESDIISDKLTVNASVGSNAFRVSHNGGTAFRVCANGGVTIGYLQGGVGPEYALQLYNSSSNMTGKARAYDWVTYSDGRLKHDQQGLQYGLEEVLQLRPKSYVHQTSIEDGRSHERDIGLIAQEVIEVIPEVVYKPVDETIDNWSVAYSNLIPVMIKAIQEQQSIITDLQRQIQSIKTHPNE